jgi:chloramphenicol 3-O phosphotransferase
MRRAPLFVLLNGTSSAGKTTTAHALRDLRGANCVALSIDAFFAFPHVSRECDWSLFFTLTCALARAATAFAEAGHDVVVDTVFERPECYDVLREAGRPFQTLLVRVDCPLEELARREAARGDRRAGLAARQYDRVHQGVVYDVVVDTSRLTPASCARRIVEAAP